jgi:hypothetical protein
VSSGGGEPQVAWIAIEQGAAVLAADGGEAGTVKEVAGDETHDIFDGLVVTSRHLQGDRYVAAERVTGIWSTRIQTDLSPAETASLPPYAAPRTTEWRADEGGGFGARMRRAWHDLFGRHG